VQGSQLHYTTPCVADGRGTLSGLGYVAGTTAVRRQLDDAEKERVDCRRNRLVCQLDWLDGAHWRSTVKGTKPDMIDHPPPTTRTASAETSILFVPLGLSYTSINANPYYGWGKISNYVTMLCKATTFFLGTESSFYKVNSL
jgi:hypothetical protein